MTRSEPRAETSASARGRKGDGVLHWIATILTFGLSLSALLLTLSRESRLAHVRANQAVSEGWDLLGGRPGTTVVITGSVDRSILEQVRRKAEEALGYEPGHPGGLRLMAMFFTEVGELKKAIEYMEKATKNAPKDSPHPYRSALAVLLARAGEVERADREFQRAIEETPRYNVGRLDYGNFLFRQGKLADAERVLSESKGINPNFYPTRVTLGEVLFQRGDFPRALEEFKAAAALSPRNPDPWFGLGNSGRKLGRYEDARYWYDLSIAINPSNGLAHCGLGHTFLELKMEIDAEKAFAEGKRLLGRPCVEFETSANP